eukprot:TRINITY_DN25614_c0_g1_i1.p1 TRINITY_DN25614_c0_g1~~TRINITY_DN25614_c0_g1_i1.p1  ORF type:complete len:109 (+),score=3.69 TRINITY_DN25614_c0_g1_i1:135-461(+)
MSAQTVRLNTISSNLGRMPIQYLVTQSKSTINRLKPIFSAVYNHFNAQQTQQQGVVPIRIADVVEVSSMMEGRYEPNNPLSNDEGYVYYSGTNVVNEMADMISATHSF